MGSGVAMPTCSPAEGREVALATCACALAGPARTSAELPSGWSEPPGGSHWAQF